MFSYTWCTCDMNDRCSLNLLVRHIRPLTPSGESISSLKELKASMNEPVSLAPPRLNGSLACSEIYLRAFDRIDVCHVPIATREVAVTLT